MPRKPGRNLPGRAIDMARARLALQMIVEGHTLAQVMEAFGFTSVLIARRTVQHAMQEAKELGFSPEEYRILLAESIQLRRRHLHKIINTIHYVSGSSGKVALDPQTQLPLVDSGPVQRALTELRHLDDQFGEYGNLKPAHKRSIGVVPEDVVDEEIKKLAEEIKRNDIGEDGRNR